MECVRCKNDIVTRVYLLAWKYTGKYYAKNPFECKSRRSLISQVSSTSSTKQACASSIRQVL